MRCFRANSLFATAVLATSGQINGRESLAHFTVWVLPDDDAMFFELRSEALGDALLHDQSSASSRPLMGFSAPANFG